MLEQAMKCRTYPPLVLLVVALSSPLAFAEPALSASTSAADSLPRHILELSGSFFTGDWGANAIDGSVTLVFLRPLVLA
jgi:hypothetical protein